MTVRQPRYSKEEFARRGDEIYESQVRPKVEAGNHGKIVAIVRPLEIVCLDGLSKLSVLKSLQSNFWARMKYSG